MMHTRQILRKHVPFVILKNQRLKSEKGRNKMKSVVIFLLSLMLTSCTISINVVHTQGSAEDLIDEQQTPRTSVSPNIDVTPI